MEKKTLRIDAQTVKEIEVAEVRARDPHANSFDDARRPPPGGTIRDAFDDARRPPPGGTIRV